MHLRRKLVLALATTGLAASLSACGFDYATDRPNDIINGGGEWNGTSHVLAARVVASQDDQGVFVATLTRDLGSHDVTFESLSAEGIDISSFEPIELKPGSMVNLADQGGIEVAGDFTAGDSLRFTVGFSDGEEAEVNAIVVAACGDYADVIKQPQAKGRGAQASAEPTPEAEGAYACEFPEQLESTEFGSEH